MNNIFFNIMVISFAFFVFLLVIILLKKYGENADRKERRMNYAAQKDTNQLVYEELNESFFARIVQPKLSKWLTSLSNTFPFLFSDNRSYAETERRIRLAGLNITVVQFNVGKTIFMLACVLLTIIVAVIFRSNGMLPILMIVTVGFILAIFLPRNYLTSKVKVREKAIRNSLPDVIDLLSVSMTAGLSFDASVKKVTEKMSGPFVNELKIMYNELQMGRPKREALKRLGECSDVPELKTFVSAVIQADQMGIPIKNILAVQSKQLRLERKMRAQEQGQKAPVKMLLPLVFCIFPVIFIILLGPAVMNIMEIF